jgi:predicted ATPase
MFRLTYLRMEADPILGNLEIDFLEQEKFDHNIEPFTTILIGPNGSGKSLILRRVAELFRLIGDYPGTGNMGSGLSKSYELRFLRGEYEFKVALQIKSGYNRELTCHKRAITSQISPSQTPQLNPPWESATEDEVRKCSPDGMIVSSFLLNDRFVYSDNHADGFYQYLGVRSQPNYASTSGLLRKTMEALLSATRTARFTSDLRDLLSRMQYAPMFKLRFETRNSSTIFTGKLDVSQFKSFFEDWEDRRKTAPFGLLRYRKLTEDEVKTIVESINELVKDRVRLRDKYHSNAKIIELDLFGSALSPAFAKLIQDLQGLYLLVFSDIQVKKLKSEFSLNDTSSGEYHRLLSLVGLWSLATQNSLILIDEPEVSMHPNWQMEYVENLKKTFSSCPGCHFIIATHSHFLVSDLKSESSSVISMSRKDETGAFKAALARGGDFYAWSAEDVLYNVFNVATSRNIFVADFIADILTELSKGNAPEQARLDAEKVRILNHLGSSLKDGDPLKEVVASILKRMR